MKTILTVLLLAATLAWSESAGMAASVNTTNNDSGSPFSDEKTQARAAEKIRLSSTGLVMKVFHVSPAYDSSTNTIVCDGYLKEFFSKITGVEWPNGAFVWYWTQGGLLIFKNTPANMARIENGIAEYNLRPKQVEIECQFVAFDASEVEKLAIKQAINAHSLTELWEKGKGRLIVAPRVVTRSGSEAAFRGVREISYPTDFSVEQPSGTNAEQVSVGATAIPQYFETREVGAIFSVIPEVSPEGNVINLNMRPEWVELEGWEDYGKETLDGTNEIRKLSMRQPVFYRSAVETQISIASGKRIMIGGGVPGKEKGTLVYTFVTCRLVDIEGKPIPPFDEVIPELMVPGKK